MLNGIVNLYIFKPREGWAEQNRAHDETFARLIQHNKSPLQIWKIHAWRGAF